MVTDCRDSTLIQEKRNDLNLNNGATNNKFCVMSEKHNKGGVSLLVVKCCWYCFHQINIMRAKFKKVDLISHK